MRKKCADCGCEVNRNVIQGMYYCPRCDDDKREIDVLPMIFFDRVTESPEVLAEEFVEPYTRWGDDGHLETLWRSNFRELSGMLFDTKDEAIAATVEKLKEAVKDEQ